MGVEPDATSAQFTSAKLQLCVKVSSKSSWAKKVYGWDGGHPGMTVW